MSAADWLEDHGRDPCAPIHHTVVIAGLVSDALSGAPIAGALIAIVAGPHAFERSRTALSADPEWRRRPEGLDRRLSRADGSFFFIDLPPGTYSLRVSAPRLGSRYGALSLEPVRVTTARGADGRLPVARADAALPPTRIRGQVTGTHGKPVAGARVRLRGDPAAVTLSDADGNYLLGGLVRGAPTLEVAARGFRPYAARVGLEAGQECSADIVLEREPSPA